MRTLNNKEKIMPDFEFYKGGKLQDRLEETANEGVNYAVTGFYGVEEVSELTQDQINDLISWYQENCATGYYEYDWYVEVSFRTAINDWFEANDPDNGDDAWM